MLVRLKEKLSLPEQPPELYDPRLVEFERDFIENAIKKTALGGRARMEKELNKY